MSLFIAPPKQVVSHGFPFVPLQPTPNRVPCKKDRSSLLAAINEPSFDARLPLKPFSPFVIGSISFSPAHDPSWCLPNNATRRGVGVRGLGFGFYCIPFFLGREGAVPLIKLTTALRLPLSLRTRLFYEGMFPFPKTGHNLLGAYSGDHDSKCVIFFFLMLPHKPLPL